MELCGHGLSLVQTDCEDTLFFLLDQPAAGDETITAYTLELDDRLWINSPV